MCGEMGEWLKPAPCYGVVRAYTRTEGSNPSLSATLLLLRFFFLTWFN